LTINAHQFNNQLDHGSITKRLNVFTEIWTGVLHDWKKALYQLSNQPLKCLEKNICWIYNENVIKDETVLIVMHIKKIEKLRKTKKHNWKIGKNSILIKHIFGMASLLLPFHCKRVIWNLVSTYRIVAGEIALDCFFL
jgi:hypothetical protein